MFPCRATQLLKPLYQIKSAVLLQGPRASYYTANTAKSSRAYIYFNEPCWKCYSLLNEMVQRDHIKINFLSLSTASSLKLQHCPSVASAKSRQWARMINGARQGKINGLRCRWDFSPWWCTHCMGMAWASECQQAVAFEIKNSEEWWVWVYGSKVQEVTHCEGHFQVILTLYD